MLTVLAPYQKAVATFVTGVIGWFGVVVAASPNHLHVTLAEWLALAVVVAQTFNVYNTPNAPLPTPPAPAPIPIIPPTVPAVPPPPL